MSNSESNNSDRVIFGRVKAASHAPFSHKPYGHNMPTVMASFTDARVLPSPEFTAGQQAKAWYVARRVFGEPDGRYVLASAPFPKLVIAILKRLSMGGAINFTEPPLDDYMVSGVHVAKTTGEASLYLSNPFGVIFASQCPKLFTHSEMHKPDSVSLSKWSGTEAEPISAAELAHRALLFMLEPSIMGLTCPYCGYRQREAYLPDSWFEHSNPGKRVPFDHELPLVLRQEIADWANSPETHFFITRQAYKDQVDNYMAWKQAEERAEELAETVKSRERVNSDLSRSIGGLQSELAKAKESPDYSEEIEILQSTLDEVNKSFAGLVEKFLDFSKSEQFMSYTEEQRKAALKALAKAAPAPVARPELPEIALKLDHRFKSWDSYIKIMEMWKDAAENFTPAINYVFKDTHKARSDSKTRRVTMGVLRLLALFEEHGYLFPPSIDNIGACKNYLAKIGKR